MAAFTLLSLMLLAPPTVKAPALRTGDELAYAGDIVEESLRYEQPYKRAYKIEVRCFVLSATDDGADLALMTLVKPVDDAKIAEAAVAVAGARKTTPRTAAVKLELIRISATGETQLLLPDTAPPPLMLTAKTRTLPVPPPPSDGPNVAEAGLFPHRPLLNPKPAIVLDGTEVVEFANTIKQGNCTRTERVWISPADGHTRVLWRRIELPGKGVHMETLLDMQPLVAHRGRSADDVKREIEFAWWFGKQVGDAKVDQASLAARIGRFKDDYPATTFREAIDSVARRITAN